MVFDGAVNQYGNGIGALIITPQGTRFSFTARLTFKCTDNMAEYEACIMGLEEAIDLKKLLKEVSWLTIWLTNRLKIISQCSVIFLMKRFYI